MLSKEKIAHLEKLAKLIRYYILFSTTNAGSGHPTSSLSATELMTALLFGASSNLMQTVPNIPTMTAWSFRRVMLHLFFMAYGVRQGN